MRDRFTHIDAERAGYRFSSPRQEDYYAVRFYPWWEHPAYLAARQNGATWGFSDTRPGRITVTVYPENTRALHLSESDEVTDWDFLDRHPLLWSYEDQVEITCNSPLSLDHVLGLMDLLREACQGWLSPFDFLNFSGGFRRFMPWAEQGAFSLGRFPRPLLELLYDYLNSAGARLYPSVVPKPRGQQAAPKLLLLDGTDYIIADDFSLDVPEVVHKPEFFSAPGG